MADTKEEFLEFLNEGVRLYGGEAITEHGAMRGDREVDFHKLTPNPFVFLRPVDLVIQGPCSDFTCYIPSRIERDAPMGRATFIGLDKVERPNMSVLDYILEEHPTAKIIVVWPTCCGRYTSTYKDLLQEVKPDITWLFPDVPDLDNGPHDRFQRRAELAEAFMEAGILGVQESEVVDSSSGKQRRPRNAWDNDESPDA